MRRFILALVVALAVFSGFSTAPASADSNIVQHVKYSWCITGALGASSIDQRFQVNYYSYLDNGGNKRVRLTSITVNNDAGGGTDYNLAFTSQNGTAWGTGSVTTSSNSFPVLVPAQANALTTAAPYADLFSGRNGDGRPMCHTTVSLTYSGS